MPEHNVLTSKSMPYLGDMSKLTFFSKIAAAVFCILASVGVSWGQLTTETLVVDGDARTYLLYLPDGHSSDQTWPLVMNFHGGSGAAEGQLAVADMRGPRRRGGHRLGLPASPA